MRTPRSRRPLASPIAEPGLWAQTLGMCDGVTRPAVISLSQSRRQAHLPTAAGRGRTHRWRRGVTFIETVCAVALLALVAASMLSAVGYLYSSQHRARQRLACAELSNRLILQYLDDPDKMPAADAPLDYGSERFRWDLREEAVVLRPAVAEESRSRLGGAAARLDRMRMLTVRVWLAEDSGGSREPALGVPSIALWRFIDPSAFRNPDAINRMISTDAGRRRLFEQYMSGGAGPGGTPPRTLPIPGNSGSPRPANAPISGGSR